MILSLNSFYKDFGWILIFIIHTFLYTVNWYKISEKNKFFFLEKHIKKKRTGNINVQNVKINTLQQQKRLKLS